MACALGTLLQACAPATAGLRDGATLSGSLNLWVRERDCAGFDPATGRDTPKATNLQHTTGHATLLFESGWIDERIGLDLGLHAGWDASNRGAPGHEINFWNVDNPYDQRPRSAGCLTPAARNAPSTAPPSTAPRSSCAAAAPGARSSACSSPPRPPRWA